jgi:hypothetical protein
MSTPADSAPERPAQMPASSFSIQAPYAPGSPDPVFVGGDADAGGRDDVAGDVATAKANAEARSREHESDTYGPGSQLGDAVTPPGASSTGTAGGSYFDPPRDY